jgi:hypothetical protein
MYGNNYLYKNIEGVIGLGYNNKNSSVSGAENFLV